MQHRHHGGPPLAPPAPPSQQHTCSSKILVDPNAKKNTASMITNNFHTALSGTYIFLYYNFSKARAVGRSENPGRGGEQVVVRYNLAPPAPPCRVLVEIG